MSASMSLAPAAPAASSDSVGFFRFHGFWAPGVRLFRQLHFASKAVLISLACFVPLLLLVAWQLKSQADQALQERMDSTRQNVEVAMGVIAHAHALETAGTLNRDQAQQQARQLVGKLRYDNREYFWINDMSARMVMHPIKPELDGQDLSAMKDPSGFALFVAFVDRVKRDGKGFVGYQWPKPGKEQPVDKLSFVQGFEPWGWVLGSGIYIDDLREAQMQRLAWSLGVIAGALLVAGYLFYSFYRVMDGGLRETRRHLHAMTEGDLTTSPSPWGRDEAAQLMNELRSMQDSLRSMVARVRRSSDQIVHASGEIAGGATDLSARTEQAAANLEESSASMEQISATVQAGADSTAEASGMASQNAEQASRGGREMQEVVATMNNIRDASTRIAEIIGTIDGIAFQTNILALNAAVEAARAGEQGRGFAVVASEVRMLAQRSAEAAREIKTLIVRSSEQVEAGTAIVQRAGATIDGIVASTGRVNQLLGDIAGGAREQSAGIGQIGSAILELDRMTQQNAALVEQTAAASHGMRDLAGELANEVARFRLPA